MKKKPINRKGNEVDRLSQLPKDILLAILDQLDTRDAARTGILARRWQQLPAKVSRLWIDCFQFPPASESRYPIDEIPRINSLVVEATKSMLSRRDPDGHAIRSIAVTFFLIDHDHILIGENVGRALARNTVETVEFTILTDMVDDELEDIDLFDYGRKFVRFVDACPDAFAGLTSLALENLRFCSEQDVDNVLSTCARLKHLHMRNCDSSFFWILRVEHLQLIELAIDNCSFEKLELTQLPKLRQLSYNMVGFLPKIRYILAPSRCSRCHAVAGGVVLECVGSHMRDGDGREDKEGLSEEKGVELGEKTPAAAGFEHRSLTSLVIFSFQSKDYLLRYIRHVMKVAVNLEAVYLYGRMACEECKDELPGRFRYPTTKRQRWSLRNKIADGTGSLATILFPNAPRPIIFEDFYGPSEY
ncbi:hypothetical protein EJB05_43276, partial [Eragrostis curvula]